MLNFLHRIRMPLILLLWEPIGSLKFQASILGDEEMTKLIEQITKFIETIWIKAPRNLWKAKEKSKSIRIYAPRLFDD